MTDVDENVREDELMVCEGDHFAKVNAHLQVPSTTELPQRDLTGLPLAIG